MEAEHQVPGCAQKKSRGGTRRGQKHKDVKRALTLLALKPPPLTLVSAPRMALDPSSLRPWRLAFLGFGAAWLALAFTHLYFYALPWMDTWCYLAPSAVDAQPLRLTAPMLGSFDGSDHAWGLHWPGVQLMNSVVFSILPAHPASWVAWETLLWLACAAALAQLTWRVTTRAGAAFTVFALILMDRGFFFGAYAQRMESMALLWLCPLIHAMIARARGQKLSPAGHLLAGLAAFLAPLTHLAAAAFAGAALAVMLWRSRPGESRGPAREAALWLAGCIALVAWFGLQPDVWSQFVAHARQGASVKAQGGMFVMAMSLFYAPTYTGAALYVIGVAAAGAGIWQGWRREAAGETRVRADLGLVALGVFILLQWLHNAHYLFPLLPALAPLGADGVLRAMAWIGRLPAPRWVTATIAAFVLLHGAFWVTRTLKYLESGRPFLRGDLASFWSTLPHEGRLFIPTALWEEAGRAPERRARARMNTIPNSALIARRGAYEKSIYENAQPGDTLVVDRFQDPPILLDPSTAGWERVREIERPMPGKTPWGYAFTVWRRRQ